LLTDFESARDCNDWTPGIHGIQIEFDEPAGSTYSATYLPEVAKEQGWTREETIRELVAKAGYKYKLTSAIRAAMRVTRYQSKKAGLTYKQYLALRKASDGSASNGHANGNGHGSRANAATTAEKARASGSG